MGKRLLFDIETDNLLADCTKVHCIVTVDIDSQEVQAYHDDPSITPRAGSIEDGLQALAQAELLVGHNIIDFDIPALYKLRGWQPSEGTVLRDTLITAKLIWPDIKRSDFRFRKKNPSFPAQMIGRHGLEAWGYRLGERKGDFGKTTDWKQLDQQMLDYCIQDCRTNLVLYEKIASKNYSDVAISIEHEFFSIIWHQVRHGWLFDERKAHELYATLSARRAELEEKLQDYFPPHKMKMKVPDHYLYRGTKYTTKGEATKAAKAYARGRKGHTAKAETLMIVPGPPREKDIPFNPGSRDHIAQRLIEQYGWKPAAYNDGDGKPTVDESILEKLDYPPIPYLCEYLMVQKRIGQVAEGKEAWLKHVKQDGRIHGKVNTNGCVTGRCTHSNPNVAQVPSMHNAKGEVPYGKECRELWTAPEGYVLVGCDASGLELRCLGHYLAAFDNGKYIHIVLHGDVHSEHQNAAGLNDRPTAKRFGYAFLYGAQPQLLGSIAAPQMKSKEQYQLGAKLRRRFLKRIQALAELQRRLKIKAETTGFLRGLDGRMVPIRSKHAVLNTLLQSAGAIIMKQAAINLKRALDARGWVHGREYAFVGNIHDEFQAEVQEQYANEYGRCAVEAIERAGEPFGFRCPLSAEYRVGGSWADTH